MSYYNQQQPPVGVPPPQGYPPPESYGKDAYPPPGYPPQGGYPPQAYPAQGYPPPYAPPQYAQPPPQQHQNSSGPGCLEGWYVSLSLDSKPGATDLPTVQRCGDRVRVALKVAFGRSFVQRSEIAAQIE
ncbi:hypothetical protein glysoja_021365 [Glycine soja]|nr:hypothetical protein glysoja_021365 [Glycine soja]